RVARLARGRTGRGRRAQTGHGRTVVAAHLAALHEDLRARRARGPILPVLAVDDDRNERHALDEVGDAPALLLIGLDLEVAALRGHVRATAVDDARAVAAHLLGEPEPGIGEGERQASEQEFWCVHRSDLRSLLTETSRDLIPTATERNRRPLCSMARG